MGKKAYGTYECKCTQPYEGKFCGLKIATVTRKAENGPKNAKNKNIGIILLKSMVVAPNGPIKWPNVLDKETMLTLEFRLKSKREKSNLSVQMALPQEKKLKLCENVAG